MSILAQFVLAWAIGLLAILGADLVDDGFMTLALATGVLLLMASVRMLTDDRAWTRFAATQRRMPTGQTTRMVFGVGLFVIGSGWAFGGIVGLLALLGVEASETARR